MLSIKPDSSDRLDQARKVLADHDEGTFRASAKASGLHEWFGPADLDDDLPPLAVLIGCAWERLQESPSNQVCWIGRRCWPYPPALVRRGTMLQDDRLLRSSLYIDADSREEIVWATELAARTPGVALIIADGRGLRMAESRRLQLACSQAGCPILLARPASDIGKISAAGARWRVTPRATRPQQLGSQTGVQRWSVELLRHKAGINDTWLPERNAQRWAVHRDYATGIINPWQACDGDLAPDVADRSLSATGTRIA